MAQEEDLLSTFFQSSGLGVDDLREQIHAPETQGALLDFLLSDDKTLLAFCQAYEHTPEDIWRARQKLPGFTPF